MVRLFCGSLFPRPHKRFNRRAWEIFWSRKGRRYAVFTGRRREEVFMMDWRDVLLAERRVVVPKSKNKKRRVLPLAAELEKLLLQVPEGDRHGYVVTIPPGETMRLSRATHLRPPDRLRPILRGLLRQVLLFSTVADKISLWDR